MVQIFKDKISIEIETRCSVDDYLELKKGYITF